MEHDEAIRLHAAERYASHQLSPAEQDAFEQHFSDCGQCANDVCFELSFMANARAVSRELPAPKTPAWEKWRDWFRVRPALAFSFAANFVLVAGFGYLLLTGTHPSPGPRFIHEPFFAPGPSKSAADVHVVPTGETSYAVRFPAPSVASQTYSYEVLDANGKRELYGSLQAPASGDGFFYLQIPLDSLTAGVHTLVVRGGAGGEIVSWSRFRNLR